MKIPDKIYNSVLNAQVTEKVLARCINSCIVQEQIYATKGVKAEFETPDNKGHFKYFFRKKDEWYKLKCQLLSYAKPVCVYKLYRLIENTDSYFTRYFNFYKIDGFKFTMVVGEQDLDRTLPVYDIKNMPVINERDLKPYPWDFCQDVLRILKEHGLHNDTASGRKTHENTETDG